MKGKGKCGMMGIRNRSIGYQAIPWVKKTLTRGGEIRQWGGGGGKKSKIKKKKKKKKKNKQHPTLQNKPYKQNLLRKKKTTPQSSRIETAEI